MAAKDPDYLIICSTSADLCRTIQVAVKSFPEEIGHKTPAKLPGEMAKVTGSGPQIQTDKSKKSDCKGDSYSSRAQMGVISPLLPFQYIQLHSCPSCDSRLH